MVLFSMLYEVLLTFESVDGILSDHLKESDSAALFWGECCT